MFLEWASYRENLQLAAVALLAHQRKSSLRKELTVTEKLRRYASLGRHVYIGNGNEHPPVSFNHMIDDKKNKQHFGELLGAARGTKVVVAVATLRPFPVR
jgi:hypothetical protein